MKKIKLTGDENSAECFEKLAVIAGSLVVEALDELESGKAVFTPQNESEATYCKKLKKSDGLIDFTLPALTVHNKVRAYYGFPGTYFEYRGRIVKIIRSSVGADAGVAPATVVCSDPKRGLKIQCASGSGVLTAELVQGEGGKVMSASDYLRGHKIEEGSVIG